MTTTTFSGTRSETGLAGIAAVALAGFALLAAAGFAQATVIHDSAHDTRHSIAFPCH